MVVTKTSRQSFVFNQNGIESPERAGSLSILPLSPFEEVFPHRTDVYVLHSTLYLETKEKSRHINSRCYLQETFQQQHQGAAEHGGVSGAF